MSFKNRGSTSGPPNYDNPEVMVKFISKYKFVNRE